MLLNLMINQLIEILLKEQDLPKWEGSNPSLSGPVFMLWPAVSPPSRRTAHVMTRLC
jgi:hypothetical protein